MKRLILTAMIFGTLVGISLPLVQAEEEMDSFCVQDGETCVMGGSPCCSALSSCKGIFPVTTCQPVLEKN